MTAEQLEELLGKVTPGEWRVEKETTLILGSCSADDTSTLGMGYPVAECRISPLSSWAKGPNPDEGEANARLIAMAPELARKVIAAEKLVKAARKTVSPKTAMLSGLAPKISVDRLMWAGVDDLEKALAAWDSAQ